MKPKVKRPDLIGKTVGSVERDRRTNVKLVEDRAEVAEAKSEDTTLPPQPK